MSSEAINAQIALLDGRGYRTFRIQQELAKPPWNYDVTPSMISQRVAELRSRYRELAQRTHEEKVQEKLAQLRDIREQAWEAWERSKEDRTATKDELAMKQAMRVVNKVAIPVGSPKLQLVKQMKELEGRLPASAYLNIVIQCLDRECELEGLTEPPPPSQTNVNIISWDSMQGRPRATTADAIEDKIKAQGDLPPIVQLPEFPKVPSTNGHARGQEQA